MYSECFKGNCDQERIDFISNNYAIDDENSRVCRSGLSSRASPDNLAVTECLSRNSVRTTNLSSAISSLPKEVSTPPNKRDIAVIVHSDILEINYFVDCPLIARLPTKVNSCVGNSL